MAGMKAVQLLGDHGKLKDPKPKEVKILSGEALPVHAALIVMQLGFAGHQVLSRVALTTGLSQFVYAIYRNGIALILMSPFAYGLEKKDRPPITPRLLFRFFMLALIGLIGGQQLYLAGLIYTSAMFAATMQNAVPVFTFLMAMILRVEKVRLDRLDGRAKTLGTVLSVSGALLMSIYKGPAVIQGWYEQDEDDVTAILGEMLGFHALQLGISQWQVGAVLLLINCICWAAYLTMQDPILKDCPTPLTVTSFTNLFGCLQVAFIMLCITQGKVTWSLSSGPQLWSVIYAGVISSGINFFLQSWAIQNGGPLLVSLYTPVQTIIVAVLSVVLLGDSLYLGSLIGGVGAVTGVYLVTWGQVEHRRMDALEAVTKVARSSPDSALTQPLLADPDRNGDV